MHILLYMKVGRGITYVNQSSPVELSHLTIRQKMVCIWKGSITTCWGAFQLYRMVDKLYFWALRILKPQISMCIDHWRHHHTSGTATLRSVLAEERNTTMLQSLNRVEKQMVCLGAGKINLDYVLLQMIIHKEFSKGSANTGVSDGNNPSPSQPSRSGLRTDADMEGFPTGTANDRSTSEPPLPRSRTEIIPNSITAGSVTETYTPVTPVPTPEKPSSGPGSQNASPRTCITVKDNTSSGQP